MMEKYTNSDKKSLYC